MIEELVGFMDSMDAKLANKTFTFPCHKCTV